MATAIWHGFELYEYLLVIVAFVDNFVDLLFYCTISINVDYTLTLLFLSWA